jgi:hypothetical protein
VSNFTTLTGVKTTEGAIRNWVNRSDIPVTDILEEAQAWIYQRLRVREMVYEEAVTFAVAASSKAISTLTGITGGTAFLDPVQFLPWGWATPMDYMHEQSHRPDRNMTTGELYSGSPTRWTLLGEEMQLDVKCIEAFGGQLMYYRQPAPLGASNQTNFLSIRYPMLLRCACMMRAYEHMKAPSMATGYMQQAELQLAEAMRTSDMSRRGQYVLG